MRDETRMAWKEKCEQLEQQALGRFLSSPAYPFRVFRQESNRDLIRSWVFSGGKLDSEKLKQLRQEVALHEKKSWPRRVWERLRYGLGKKRSLLRVLEWQLALERFKQRLSPTVARGELQAAAVQLNACTQRIRTLNRFSRFRRKLDAGLEAQLSTLQAELSAVTPVVVSSVMPPEPASAPSSPSPALPLADVPERKKEGKKKEGKQAQRGAQAPSSNQVLLDQWLSEQERRLAEVFCAKNKAESLRARGARDKEKLVLFWRNLLSFFHALLPKSLQNMASEAKGVGLSKPSWGRRERLNYQGLVRLVTQLNKVVRFNYHPDKNQGNEVEAGELFSELNGFLLAAQEMGGVIYGGKNWHTLTPEAKDILVCFRVLQVECDLFEVSVQQAAAHTEEMQGYTRSLEASLAKVATAKAMAASASATAASASAMAASASATAASASATAARARATAARASATATSASAEAATAKADAASANAKLEKFMRQVSDQFEAFRQELAEEHELGVLAEKRLREMMEKQKQRGAQRSGGDQSGGCSEENAGKGRGRGPGMF